MNAEPLIETFPALSKIPFLKHAFIGRVPGIDVRVEREMALQRLDEAHTLTRQRLSFGDMHFVTGEQVHGSGVAIVGKTSPSTVPDVDALITEDSGVCLGIYVADCSAVYLIDPQRRVIGLVHSGRRGTELGVTRNAIEKMVSEFGCEPAGIIAQLSPCIRPPNYEVDFAAQIVEQCRSAGISQVIDCATCTASNPQRYYSFRTARGKTGRMLALLAQCDYRPQ